MFQPTSALKISSMLVFVAALSACAKETGTADPESPASGSTEPDPASGEPSDGAGADGAAAGDAAPSGDPAPNGRVAAPAEGSSGPTGSKACGARAGDTCAANEYCAYQAGQYCGAADAEATCKPRPEMCTRDYRPVCGCDNKTYGNACTAAAAGQGVLLEGECKGEGGPET